MNVPPAHRKVRGEWEEGATASARYWREIEVERRISPLRRSETARAPSVEMTFFVWVEEESKNGRLCQMRHTVGREKTMIGDGPQYRDLVALYGTYSDEELVELGRGMADLTEMAQEALKGELTRRGLKIAPAGEAVETRVLSEEDLSDMRAYAESAPVECIFDFENERAVTAAYYALTAEGIEAIVVSGGVLPDRRGPRVVVTPKDAERAAAILSRPSAEELKVEAEEAFAGFDLP